MNFSWTDTQDELYRSALSFARQQLGIHAGGGERAFTRDRWAACAKFGLTGLCAPKPFGLGLDAVTTARVLEAFGRASNQNGLIFATCAHLFACVMPIVEHGSEALKAKYLPDMCGGNAIGANAMTEAEAGSDVFALKAKATRDGDTYRLNGTKNFVTNGPVADVFVTYASTNPAHGYLGITAFLVPRDAPGLVVGEPFEKIGLRGASISQVYFDDCVVPESHRLGEEGQGAVIFTSSMAWERACLFAFYVGMMERQLEAALEQAKSRRQFRVPIGKNQAISHRIVNMKLRLESARMLLYRACWLFDQGADAGLDISLAKLAISEGAIQSGLDSIQIHGGAGVIREVGVEQDLRDAIPGTLFSGTSEMQRDIIAARLGL